MSTRPRRAGAGVRVRSSSPARVAAVPSELSSGRIPVLRLNKLEGTMESSLASVTTADKIVPAGLCLDGLDFLGYCPICLRKLLDNDSDDGGGDGGSFGQPITPRNIPLKSASRVWQYLHSSSFMKNSTTTTPPRFTFRMEEVGQAKASRGISKALNRRNAAGSSSEVANLPTMCITCYGEVLKLRKLHEELLAIEITLKSQVDTIKKIVEGSASRKMKFEETISTSHGNNGEWMDGAMTKSKAFQFLQYIGAELNPSVPKSKKRKTNVAISPVPVEDSFKTFAEFKEEPAPSSASSSSSDSDFDMAYNNVSMSGDEDASSDWGDQADKNPEIFIPGNVLSAKSDAGSKSQNRRTRGKSWACRRCSKIFPTQSMLESHTTSEHNVPTLRCHICSEEFDHGDHLNAHVRSHKEDRPPSTCDVCGRCFAQPCLLRDHMKSHTGERPFCCEHCGKGFRVSGYLREHKHNAHRDIYGARRTFSCELCGKVCYKRSALGEHMLIHSGIKPWVCEVCGKEFRKKHSMQSHWRRMHSKPRPGCNANAIDKKPGEAVCLICDMKFTHRTGLAGHNKRFHTDWMPFSCEECNIGIKSKYLLRDHQNIVHIKKVSDTSVSVEPAERPEMTEAESAATPDPDDTPESSEPIQS